MIRRALKAIAFACLMASGLFAHDSWAQITLVYSDWQLAESVWNRSLREAFEEFERQNPGIKVKLEPVALGQRDTRYTTALRAGKGPDVFALDANPIKQYIKEGWVRDLTPFLAKDSGKMLDDWYPSLMEPVTEGGRIFGLPKNVSPTLLIYNTELFAAAGVASPPKTWDEFRDAARKLTRAAKPGGPVDQWGTLLVLAPAGFDLRMSSVLRGFGGDFLTPDGKHSALNSQHAKAAINFVVDMINGDRTMAPGITQIDANGGRQLIANSKVGMIIEGLTIPTIADINPKLDARRVLRASHIPQNPGEMSKIRSTYYMKSIFMNPNTEQPEAAWKLMKYITERKQMEKWFSDSGLLSARRSVNETFSAIQNDQFAMVARSEIEHGAFLPQTPKWPEILETFRQAIQAAVTKSKTPDQALADAHQAVEAILARP